MNQILVTKKLYVTPELKRKKKIYKVYFILSVFLVFALMGVYVYSEYDRNKGEGVAQDILASMATTGDDSTTADNDILVVVLDETQVGYDNSSSAQEQSTPVTRTSTTTTTAGGKTYVTAGTISIPQIGVNYPILVPEELTTNSIEETLKVSPCKFWGGDLNEVGNYCIVGHNYRNNRFFSKVPTLNIGETFDVTDASGRTISYKIYDMYTVDPTDVSCTSQLTNGKKEVTLITCTDDSKDRVIVKAREV